MAVKITARWWGKTPVALSPGGTGSDLFLGSLTGSGDGEWADEEERVGLAYLDLDPDPTDPERPFNCLQIEGTLDDFRGLIAWLQEYVDVNEAEPEGAPYQFGLPPAEVK